MPSIFIAGSDIVAEIFHYISVKQTFIICRLNVFANLVCQKESLWKDKIPFEYGIKKKYGKTWKETAKLLCKSNMINLEKKWVNGKTYGELLEEAVKSDDNFFFNIIMKNRGLPNCIYFPKYYNVVRANHFISQELKIYHTIRCKYALKKHMKVVTREFAIIVIIVNIIKDRLPSKIEFSEKQQKIILVDPIPYIMIYSLVTEQELAIIYNTYVFSGHIIPR